MKIIVNQSLPLYINKKEMFLRLGNLPISGRIIENIDSSMEALLKLCSVPITIHEIIAYFTNKKIFNPSDVRELVKVLLKENILVKYDDLKIFQDNTKYSRQLLFYSMFNEINDSLLSQNKFTRSTVAILGMGSIGGNVAIQLARSGIINLIIVDFDIVEESNIERQLIYDLEDVGELKIVSCIKHLKKINANINIKYHNKKIDNIQDVSNIITQSDFVLSTIDKPSRKIRSIVNKACVKNRIPVSFCGFSEYLGLVGPLVDPYKSACLECSELNMGLSTNTEYLNPNRMIASFGPLCGLISNIASFEIIKYLSEFEITSTLSGSTLIIDLLNYSMEKKEWIKSNNCTSCIAW